MSDADRVRQLRNRKSTQPIASALLPACVLRQQRPRRQRPTVIGVDPGLCASAEAAARARNRSPRCCFRPVRFGSCRATKARDGLPSPLFPACAPQQRQRGYSANRLQQQLPRRTRLIAFGVAESMDATMETPLLRRCTACAACRDTTCDRGARCPAQDRDRWTEHLARSPSHDEPPARCRFPAPSRLRWRWRACSQFHECCLC